MANSRQQDREYRQLVADVRPTVARQLAAAALDQARAALDRGDLRVAAKMTSAAEGFNRIRRRYARQA